MSANKNHNKDLKILLVDDEEELVSTLAERMGMRGLDTEVAPDGPQAIDALKTRIPHVMVLDLRMPVMDGMDVLRHVKKNNPEIQVIILTGHGSAKDEEQARRLGAFDYLQKPVDVETLVNRIKKAYRHTL